MSRHGRCRIRFNSKAMSLKVQSGLCLCWLLSYWHWIQYYSSFILWKYVKVKDLNLIMGDYGGWGIVAWISCSFKLGLVATLSWCIVLVYLETANIVLVVELTKRSNQYYFPISFISSYRWTWMRVLFTVLVVKLIEITGGHYSLDSRIESKRRTK